MIIKKLLPPALLALALSLSLHAGEINYAYVYLATPPDELIVHIPPPPEDDSLAGMADVETLLQLQKDRTPEQIERAKHVSSHTAMQMGASVFGPEFNKKNLPFTARFMKDVTYERHLVLEIAKKRWTRVRPYDRGLGITPCVSRPHNTSYPSGHSAAAANWAVVYSAMFPEYAKLFDDEMREAMWCRVLGGAHYPSDTMGGKIAGVLIGEGMLKNPVTQKALKQSRAEIDAFLEKNPKAKAHVKKRLAESQAPAS